MSNILIAFKVKEEQDKVKECERFLLMAEKENIEKFNKNIKHKESKPTEEVDVDSLKKNVDGLQVPDQIVIDDDVIISRIEEEDGPIKEDFSNIMGEESDIKVTIREDDENDIKITVKEDSDSGESNPETDTEEIAKYKFPTF